MTLFYGPEQGLCRVCLRLITYRRIYTLLDFDQMWLESKDNRNYKGKKEILKNMTFSYMGAELVKGRNLLAETSGGQIRKGPKPLATYRPTPSNADQFVWFGQVWSGKKLTALIVDRIYPWSTLTVSTMHPRSNPALPDLFLQIQYSIALPFCQ